MKKALALFLTLALLISMLPTASLAVEDKTPETTSEAQSAEEQAEVVVTEEEPSAVYEEVEEEPDSTVESGEDVSETAQSDETASDEQAAPDLQEDPDVQKESENEEVGTPTQEEMVEEVSTPEETVSQTPAAAQEETAIVASGTCGNDLTWTLDSAGTLTISGTGAMSDYSNSYAPWYSNCSSITSAVIEDGVTSVGSFAFEDCSNLTSITIGSSVTNIKEYAFKYCSSLTSVEISDSVKIIGAHAFYECSSLVSIEIPAGVSTIGNSAFYNCANLTEIEVDSQNAYIASSEGVLFHKGMEELICYPCGKVGSYAIPSGVTSISSYAFYNCSNLTSITIPDSVTNIGWDAFYNCSSLTSVIIPDSVTNIGSGAFYNCSNLTSVMIPDSVTSIVSSTFYNCSSLTGIEIPDSVTNIGGNAFYNCSSLTSIEIPDSVTSIGFDAFYNCSSLTGVKIGSGITEIGAGAFEGCINLTKVYIADIKAWCETLFGNYYSDPFANPLYYGAVLYLNGELVDNLVVPDSVTSIEEYAFYNYSGLTSVEIPGSVTSIGSYAFYNCSSLTSVTIPDSVTSIGGYAFYNCSSLTSVTIPDSVTSIGERAFGICSSLTSVTIPDGITSIEFQTFYGCSSLTSVTIPDGVTSIKWDAFRDCSSLTSVTIPDSVTSIGGYAFHNCSSLTSIEIPDSVTSIEQDAFHNCSSLTSVKIGSGVTSIGNSAFEDCSSLIRVTIPSSVTSIGADAFNSCSSLAEVYISDITSWCEIRFGWDNANPLYNGGALYLNGELVENLVIPSGVTSVNEFTFAGCSSLTSVEIPDSVTSIGGYAFRNCSSLTSIKIPSSVTSIGEWAFHSCSSLAEVYISDIASWCKLQFGSDNANPLYNGGALYLNGELVENLVIPDSVTSIEDYAFYNYSGLTSVTIPDGVTSIKTRTFYGCSSLTSVTIPDSVTSIGSDAFYKCSSLTSVTIPDGVTSIKTHTFYGCSSLTSVTIPDSVTSIGSYAFYDCSSLTSVTIPDSVTSIEEWAFGFCSRLTDVYYSGSEEMWGKILIKSESNWHLTDATIHYNSVGPDGGGGTSNSDSFRFGGYSSEWDDSGADYAMINAEEDAVLQGILEVNDEQDIQTEFDSIVWTVSDPSVAEITDSKLGEEDLVGSHWTVSVKGLRPGTVTVTGTTRDGRTASKEITVEPQMVIDVPKTISMATDVTCTVYLNEPDAAFLEQYMQQLDSSFTCDADDYYLPYIVPDLPGGIAVTNEFFADISYSVAANGLSAVYTISVLPNGRWGSLTGQINFVAGSGFSRSASTTLYMSNAQFNFLNIDGSEDDWPKTSIAWENGHYDLTEITAKLTITYYPTDGISKASVDKISFSLDNLGLFKIDGESVIEPDIQLAPGESYSCTVTLVKRGMFWQKPDEGETWTGTINAVIDGVFPNASMQNDLSLTVDISRPVEDSEENTDSEQEKLDQEIVSGAEDAINAFYDLDDKIALNEQIYADQWLGKDAAEALRVLIYTEISLASMSEEIWQKEGSLSAKVVDRIFDQYLGNWQLQTGTSTIELPISAYFRNARNQRIQCDVICTVDGYTFNQQLYGITANIVIKLTNMDTYQISTFYGSMLSKADIQTFAEAAWSVASAELRSGYKNVWASGVDEEISKLAEDSIEYLASKATSYGFEETVKVILKRFYEDKLGSVFSSQTFQLLTYPSKMAVVHCPVDLFIYDASGALVGSIEGDEVTLTGDKLVLWTEGDDKYVQLFDDSYRIEYVATGTGNMSIEIYDQANGVTNLRMCAYSNIPLEPGLNYTGYVDDEILTDVNNYDLMSSKDNVITASSVTYFEDSAMDCSGTLTSWEADTEATYYLYDDSLTDEEIRADLAQSDHEFALYTGTGSEPSIGTDGRYEQQFSFCDILPGTYKLVIYKTDKYVPQVLTVTVEQTSQDLGSFCLQMLGDVNGDGKVTTIDAALANSCARGASDLEAYALACADVSGNDGKVTVIDAALINAHARGVSSLWG